MQKLLLPLALFGSLMMTNGLPLFARGGTVTILNDTRERMTIHTGSGIVTLNARGGRTSVNCVRGRRVSRAARGRATTTIFTINPNMCGSTVKLSAY